MPEFTGERLIEVAQKEKKLVMEKADLLAIFDREQRIEVQFPDEIRENTGRVIRSLSVIEPSGFIGYSALDEACAEAEIEAQVAFFADRGVPFEWKVYDHDRPADLRQRLAARGFVIEEPEALMVLDMEHAPDLYESAALPEAIRRVTDPAGVDGVVCMKEEVWQDFAGWTARTVGTRPGKHAGPAEHLCSS